jgi:hypothetical protein
MAMTTTAVLPESRVGQQTRFFILHEFPGPELEAAWRDCLSRVECPAHYDAPEFFLDPRLARDRLFAVLALEQDKVVGVLTGLHERNEAVSGLASRPQVCLGHSANADTGADALIRGLLAETRHAKVLTVYSWTHLNSFSRGGFRFRPQEGAVVLNLAQGSEVLFKQMDKKRRNGIRVALRADVEIFQPNDEEDIRAFYSVYSAWHGTTRKKIHGEKVPLAVFEQRFHQRANFQMFLARYSGKVIAGITLRFVRGGLIEYANNSSLDDFLYLRPNDLLLWHAIEWACREGFSRFSLGGAHRFLREFGGTLTPIYRYRLDQTWLRQHDRREELTDWGREKLRQMPPPVEKAIRRIFGK